VWVTPLKTKKTGPARVVNTRTNKVHLADAFVVLVWVCSLRTQQRADVVSGLCPFFWGVASVFWGLGFSVHLWMVLFMVGEFDPGSGRTLAACLTHASRTLKRFRVWMSGERVSNTWVICPALWDKPWKRGLIPDRTCCCMVVCGKLLGGVG
jgi:hypothetical protein